MLGIIGGTSLLEFSFTEWEKKIVYTPYGSSEVLCGKDIILLLRHQGRRAPHRIPYRAHLAALAVAGATRIISIGSTGSLKHTITPGSLVIPETFFTFSRVPSIFDHTIGHVNVEFSPDLITQLCHLLPDAYKGGTYIQTEGPRFETVAEIEWMAGVADIVGMTVASEAIIAQELSIPFAAVCTVDNYANGISSEEVTYDQIVANSKLYQERTKGMLHTICTQCTRAG